MTPEQRIRELIMCPLIKCYPADPPRKHRNTPQGLASLVATNRRKTKRYLEEVRIMPVSGERWPDAVHQASKFAVIFEIFADSRAPA